MDITRDGASYQVVQDSFRGQATQQGSEVVFRSDAQEADGNLTVMVAHYREYPNVPAFLKGEGLFDMGSPFKTAQEPMRILLLRSGKVPATESVAWESLPATSLNQLVSPQSQRDKSPERWKQSQWYEPDLDLPCNHPDPE